MSKYQPIFDLYNAKLMPLLMNVHNIEVLGVHPYNGVDGVNTQIELRVDRSIDQNGQHVAGYNDDNRYFERTVEVQRFNLTSVVTDTIKAVLNTAIASHVDEDTTVATEEEVIAVITDPAVRSKIVLLPDDVKIVKVYPEEGDAYHVVIAKANSLGFVGSVSLQVEGEGTDPVEPSAPWATAGEVILRQIENASGAHILSAKFGESIRLRLATSASDVKRFAAYIEVAGVSKAVACVTAPDGDLITMAIPAFTNNGAAATNLVICGEDNAVYAKYPIYMMNATVNEGTLALGHFTGTVIESYEASIGWLPASTLNAWTTLKVLRGDDSNLEDGTSNMPFPRTIEYLDLENSGKIEFKAGAGFSCELRAKDGVALTAHLPYDLGVVANEGAATSIEKSTGTATAYVEPASHKLLIKGAAVEEVQITPADSPIITIANQTELDISQVIMPAEWAPVTQSKCTLVSTLGEDGITYDAAQGKLIFSKPVEEMVDVEIHVVMRSVLEASVPLIGSEETIEFGMNTYNFKLKRVLAQP